jgi:transcriptional regulator with XRE-family HTH domain
VAENSASPLGEFIRRQRELSEVSMRRFAEVVGISNPYLSQIERGLRAPSEQVVQSIADALQVSADTLYEQAGLKSEEDDGSEVIEAIRRDPRLTGRQRQALIEIYQSFAGIRSRPRRRRTTAGSSHAGEPNADGPDEPATDVGGPVPDAD